MFLRSFHSSQATLVASWVRSDEELRWLAPSTLPPLTPEKVADWRKTGGHSLVGFARGTEPVAYGELNPMRYETGHMWLGHLVVDPGVRRLGLGRQFVAALLGEAFSHHHARRVSLVVFPENEAATRCYRLTGFRLVGEERHRFIAGGEQHRLLRYECVPGCVKTKVSEATLPSVGRPTGYQTDAEAVGQQRISRG